LTKTAWALIRREPTMLWLAMIATGIGFVDVAAFLYLSGSFHPATHSRGDIGLAGLIMIYPTTFIAVFFDVAMAAAANASFEGRSLTVGEALGEAWKRRWLIVKWALLATGVGILLEQIASRIPFAGRLATWLVGMAWALATIFVVPLLALEDRGPIEAAKESAGLIRRRWGEGITGLLGIGGWTLIVVIPALVIGAAGVAIRVHDPNAGAALIAIAVGILFLVFSLSRATGQVFTVALYRYAIGIDTDEGFAAADLADPFKRRGE
jgi:hypothetical protein